MAARIDWDTYFQMIASEVQTRSSCLRRQVGAVLVSTDRAVLATGYNGTPFGIPNCNDGGCERCATSHPDPLSGRALEECICVHAEQNAIALAARNGIRTKEATLYTTIQPCLGCLKLAIQAGILRIVYLQPYSFDPMIASAYARLLTAANVEEKAIR